MEILQKCNVKGQTQKSKSPLFYKIVSVALWFCTLRRSSECHGDHPPLHQTSLQLRWKLNFIIRWWHIYTVIKRKRSPFHIRNISVTQALKHLNHKKWGWLCNTKVIRREVPYINDWATIRAPADLIGGPSVYSCASTHHHVRSQYNDLLISVSGTLTPAHRQDSDSSITLSITLIEPSVVRCWRPQVETSCLNLGEPRQACLVSISCVTL